MTSQKHAIPGARHRAENLRFIPINISTLGWVGSAHTTGLFAGEFSRFNPDCEQYQYSSMSALASSGEPYDCIYLLGRQLALPDIEELLNEASGSLSPSGCLIVDIENPFFYKILQTKPLSLEAVLPNVQKFVGELGKQIEQAGLIRERIRWLPAAPGSFEQWLSQQPLESASLSPQLKQILVSPILQCRLMRHSVDPISIQAQVLKPVGGVNDVRITEPLSALATLPGLSCRVSRKEGLLQGASGVSKIMILHRPILSLKNSLAGIQKMREAGYLIITEFDDHPSPWPAIEENGFLTFAGVHAVQTTTPELARYLKQYNPEIGVFPNQLNGLTELVDKSEEEAVSIFFGALNRQEDWEPVMDGINQSLKAAKHPFTVDVVFDRDFFEALETNNKSFTPQCSYADYKARLQQADIALMPLRDTEFNRMKSDLKFIESAGQGAVPVASSVVYEACDPEGERSIICKEPEEFGPALLQLINDKEQRLRLQKNGYQYVKSNRLLCHHVESRLAWYRSLLAKKEMLDQALEARLERLSF